MLRRIDTALFNKFSANLRRVTIGLPGQVRDLIDRPDIRSRISVAVKAKRHIQRLNLLHFHHLIDPTVATDTAHTGGHVGLMVEEHEIGDPVNTYPLDGLTGREALPNLF